MKRLGTLFCILLGAVALLSPAASRAMSFEVHVGDQPYYEGREFWDWGWHWVWVPGHWDHHHHWIHGYYMRSGNWNDHYVGNHHRWHHHDDHGHNHD